MNETVLGQEQAEFLALLRELERKAPETRSEIERLYLEGTY